MNYINEKESKKKKLFNLKAMEEIVELTPFLKNAYEKLSAETEDGGPEERLGYHWNEVIHTILFNKYIKTDKDLMFKYKTIRDNINKENNDDNIDLSAYPLDDEELKESTTTVGSAPSADGALSTNNSGAYSTPSIWAKSFKDWKNAKKPIFDGGKIIIPNTEKHIMGINSYKVVKENYLTDLDYLDKLLFEDIMGDIEPPQEIEEHHISTRNARITFILNTTDQYTEDELNNMKDEDIAAIYFPLCDKEFGNNTDNVLIDNNKIEEEYLYTVKDEGNDLVLTDENGESSKIEKNIVGDYKNLQDLETKLKKLNIITNKSKIMENKTENLFEDIMNSLNSTNNSKEQKETIQETGEKYTYYINLDKPDDFYADVRDEQSNTIFEINDKNELEQLISKGAMKDKNDMEGLENYLKNQDIIPSDSELILGNISETINEDIKPVGLIQAEKIKEINKKNSLGYYKDLNKGIQDMIDGKEGSKMEFNYDNDAFKSNEIPKNDNKEAIDIYHNEVHRGTENYILDRKGNEESSKKYDERLEKEIGKDNFDIVKKKEEVIKDKELRNTPYPGRVLNMNESITGFYLDKLRNKKIKTFFLNEVKEGIDKDGLKKLETIGLGNLLKESVKDIINSYDFYFNEKDNDIYSFTKEIKKTYINENFLNKTKKLINYNTRDNVNMKKLIDKKKLK